MNPAIAAAIAQGVSALIEIWRNHSNKPKDWVPTAEDWDALLALNDKTAQDYKDEAKSQLGK
jgi:hypothetical protein